MRLAQTARLTVFTGLVALLGVANAEETLDSGAACDVLQKAIAKRDNLPDSGPPASGWFCDITPSKDPTVYVIALRTSKPRPQGNLVGWYAVTRASGAIHEWDVRAQRIGMLKVPGNGAAR